MSAVRRPAALGLVAAVLVLVAWWQLLWQPQSAALAEARRQGAQASTNLYQAGQRLGHLKHLAATADQMASLDQRVSAAVPPHDDLDGFLLSLNAMSHAAAVQVRSVSPSPPAPGPGGLSQIAVSLSVSGGYFDVQRFLDAVKGGPRLVVIDGISEGPQSTDARAGGSSVVAQISAHLLTGLARSSAASATGGR